MGDAATLPELSEWTLQFVRKDDEKVLLLFY